MKITMLPEDSGQSLPDALKEGKGGREPLIFVLVKVKDEIEAAIASHNRFHNGIARAVGATRETFLDGGIISKPVVQEGKFMYKHEPGVNFRLTSASDMYGPPKLTNEERTSIAPELRASLIALFRDLNANE